MSFCLFKNQSGILYCLGFCIIVITLSTSSSESSPALFVASMSAFFKTIDANLLPTPCRINHMSTLLECHCKLIANSKTYLTCTSFQIVEDDLISTMQLFLCSFIANNSAVNMSFDSPFPLKHNNQLTMLIY